VPFGHGNAVHSQDLAWKASRSQKVSAILWTIKMDGVPPAHEEAAAVGEERDEESIQWGREDGWDDAFWPLNEDEEEAFAIHRLAILRVVRNVYRGEQSISDVLRVIEDMDGELDFFAFPMRILGNGWTCHSLFGLFLWALPTGKLQELLRELELRQSDVWSTRLGAEQETLLHLATREHPPMSVLRLIAEHEEGKLIGNVYGQLPMHGACFNRAFTTDFLVVLLDTRGEALRQVDLEGLLPLHAALRTTGRGRGQATLAETAAIRWMVAMYPEAQTSVDHDNKTPLMLALMECGTNNDCISPLVLGLFSRLVNDTPASLRATRLLNGSEDVVSTALHVVAEAEYVREALVRFVLTNDNESLRLQDWRGDLPLHKICSKFVEYDGANDIWSVVNMFLEQYGDGLETRNAYGFTPVHLAIQSWGLPERRPIIAPEEELLTLIRRATAATLRGTDRRSQGMSTSGSCLEYAYGNIRDPLILATLFENSPTDILLMDEDTVPNNDVGWFRSQSDEAFLVVLEITLHPTAKDLVTETKRREIQDLICQFFPHLADASPHCISCTFAQRVVGRELRNIREFLMDDQEVRDMLYNDLGPGGNHLTDMVCGLLRGNRVGRVHQAMHTFDSDEHMRFLLVMNSVTSAVYLHLQDSIPHTGSLDFHRAADNIR
jgi:hypothetical protein